VNGEARNFSKQRRLDTLGFDAERWCKMEATHVHVVADANDRVRASFEAYDAVRNARQLNHTFYFACHVFKAPRGAEADYARASAIV
jgi:hypothetical protein